MPEHVSQILPLFAAAGFAVGYAWAWLRLPVAPAPPRPQQDVASLWTSILFIVALAVAMFAAVHRAVGGAGLVAIGLMLSALGIGAAAGRWFERTHSQRDRVLFLAAALLALITAGLDYDYGLFRGIRGLTKVSAGGVDLEFSARPGDQGDMGSTIWNPDASQKNAFAGAARLTVAIGFLRQLGEWVLRDEKYARLLSGGDPTLRSIDEADPPRPRALVMARYACIDIAGITDQLKALQDAQQSEISGITVRPRLVAQLRLAYELARAGHSPDLSWTQASPTVGLSQKERHVGVEISQSMQELEEDLESELLALGRTSEASINEDRPECSGYFGADRRRLKALPFDGAPDDPEFAGYVAYLAIAAAVTEFAAGNHENAIQILESEIRRQIQIDPKLDWPPPLELAPADCKAIEDRSQWKACGVANRLPAVRRIVTVARLEFVQDQLIHYSSGSDVPAVHAQLLQRYVATLDAAQSFVGKGETSEFDPFLKTSMLGPPARCEIDRDLSAEARKLFAGWQFTRAQARNNLLWAAVLDPEMVAVNPAWRPKLDAAAAHAARFDFSCAERWTLSLPAATELRIRFLDSAAAYWLTEGQDFGQAGVAGRDSDPAAVTASERTKALCAAASAYAEAARLSNESPRYPRLTASSADSLDVALKAYQDGEFRLHLLKGRQAAQAALARQPSAQAVCD